jgi:hypothetical protein
VIAEYVTFLPELLIPAVPAGVPIGDMPSANAVPAKQNITIATIKRTISFFIVYPPDKFVLYIYNVYQE